MISNRKASTLAKKQRPWWNVGSKLTEVKMTSGGRVPKCSVKKQVYTIFLPGLWHASFAPKCGHVRMSKYAMHVDLSRQMKKKQINKHSPRFSANLGHPTENTNVFCKTNQNTFVFCHTPGNCYHICTYCHANNSKAVISLENTQICRYAWEPAGTFIFRHWLLFSDGV